MRSEFVPEFFDCLREGIPRNRLVRDLLAGLVVGIVALPLAIAFGIASGVQPEQGIYTAIVAGFLISLLSGSRVQIGGPTGAFVALVFAIVHEHGYDGLVLATLMAGVLLILMGLARLGTLIQFIPYPVTVGFTAGIALVIAAGQLHEVLGLEMTETPSGFVARLAACYRALPTVEPWSVGLAASTIAILVLSPRILPRVPASLAALVVASVVVAAFELPVETVGSRFGAISSALPRPRLPEIDLARIPDLISPALAIALLAGIESLLSAVVADGMTGGRHRPNAELVAQGVANIASPLFGGIPATGAIARTATNVKSGGATPLAGMTHALVLLGILVVAAPWAARIPMACLGGILLVVAWNMSERHLFAKVLRSTRGDALVLVTTFALTVLVDLTIAIQVGLVLASVLFMGRMAAMTRVRLLSGPIEGEEGADARALVGDLASEGIEVYEVAGPFFFGAAHRFKTTLAAIHRRPRVLILRLRHVPWLDATGLHALEDLRAEARRGDTALVLSGLQEQPREVLARAGFLEGLGPGSDQPDLESALGEARSRLATLSGPNG